MTKLYEEEYTKFLEKHEMCDFQQSIEWEKVKKYWKNEIIIVYNGNAQIIATMSILIRKIPFFGNLMYVPRGPVCNILEKDILEKLTIELKKIAKKYKAFVVRIEPNVKKDNQEFVKIVEELGYKINSTAMDFKQEIQARHNFRLNLKGKTKEEVFEKFSSKTRYNIRLAKKRGVEIRKLGLEGMDDFYEIMKETGRRDGFRIRPKEYLSRIYEEFTDRKVCLLVAYYEQTPIAGIMPIMYGNKMWYLYGASSNKNRNVMPNYLLQWTAIEMAIENKLELYDFRGVSMKDGQPDGLYRFKSSFGSTFVELIGEIYIDFKPLKYKLYKKAEKYFREIRGHIYNLKIKIEDMWKK